MVDRKDKAMRAMQPVPLLPKRAPRATLALAAATAALAALSGCTLAPTYERPALPTAAAFPATGLYANGAGQPGAGGVPQGGRAAAEIGWHEFFQDARLRKLIEIALANNRDLRVAVLKVGQAREQYRIQRAALLPSVSATGAGTRARTPYDLSSSGRSVVTSDYSVGASASWELDLFGRVQSLRDQALATYLSTAQARKAAEIALVAQVADQYLAMLGDDEQLRVTQATLDTARHSYALAKVTYDNGSGSELDLSQAEGVVRQAEANYQSQQRLRAQAENALVLLLGEPMPADLPPAGGLDGQALLADIPAGLPSQVLLQRPDVMAAEQDLVAANANIGAARAAFFPTVSLTGNVGTASVSLGGLFQPGSLAWSFAPQITLPIFRGGENRANLSLAELQKQAQVASYEKAIQSAFREVADGLAARATYDKEIESLQRNASVQQRRLELSDLRYRNGVDSYLDVLTAQTDLYSARQSLVSAQVARLTNLVDLYRYLGGGWIARSGETPRAADADT